MQRIQEESATNARRAQLAEDRAQKLEIAAEVGIPVDIADQWAPKGDTRDEQVKNARLFAERFGLTPPSNGDRQRPDFSSGVRRPVQRATTMNDVIRQAAGR